MNSRILITCEHGGNDVPAEYARLFRGQRQLLASHRGYDAGALEIAQFFAAQLEAPLVFATVTRLLVNLNRSSHHRQVFSEFTRPLDEEAKTTLLREHYAPYRERVANALAEMLADGERAVHLSMHSFTPEFNGVKRTADVGLLYDSRRRREAGFCRRWGAAARHRRPDLRVRCNYPYLGKADGLTTSLRRRFSESRYLGIELEVNRARWTPNRPSWRVLQQDLLAALRETLAAW